MVQKRGGGVQKPKRPNNIWNTAGGARRGHIHAGGGGVTVQRGGGGGGKKVQGRWGVYRRTQAGAGVRPCLR